MAVGQPGRRPDVFLSQCGCYLGTIEILGPGPWNYC